MQQSTWSKIWGWLNGNKTTIGLVLGYLLSKQWFDNLVGSDVVDALNWIAVTFIGVGIAHKAIKSDTTPEPNK